MYDVDTIWRAFCRFDNDDIITACKHITTRYELKDIIKMINCYFPEYNINHLKFYIRVNY